MEKILIVYTPEHGPVLEFIKALRLLYKKYGHFYGDYDEIGILKKVIKEEYGATFVNDDCPRLVFKNEKQKTMFLIRFN
jgi:hypothetical protein